MSITFYVEAEQPCPECRGTGVVTHPAWRAYWAENHGRSLPTAEDDEQWFSHRGYDGLPPEEVVCDECDGTGVLRQRAPLTAALAALGWSQPAPTKGGAA